MKVLDNLSFHQDQSAVAPLKCLHSQVSDRIASNWGPWATIWPINIAAINPNSQNFQVDINQNIEYVKLKDQAEFLACYRNQKTRQISVLNTFTAKMKVPFCYKCFMKPCKCLRAYTLAAESQGRLHKEQVHDTWKL